MRRRTGSLPWPKKKAPVAATVRRIMTVPTASLSGPPAPVAASRRRLPPAVRRALLTVHIVASVGLLGDSAGFTAVAIRAATTPDPALAAASYQTLDLFSL